LGRPGRTRHGTWDWLHDLEVVPARFARWLLPLCAAFDFAMALFVLLGIGA
jgi:hypothetical protein